MAAPAADATAVATATRLAGARRSVLLVGAAATAPMTTTDTVATAASGSVSTSAASSGRSQTLAPHVPHLPFKQASANHRGIQ